MTIATNTLTITASSATSIMTGSLAVSLPTAQFKNCLTKFKLLKNEYQPSIYCS